MNELEGCSVMEHLQVDTTFPFQFRDMLNYPDKSIVEDTSDVHNEFSNKQSVEQSKQ